MMVAPRGHLRAILWMCLGTSFFMRYQREYLAMHWTSIT